MDKRKEKKNPHTQEIKGFLWQHFSNGAQLLGPVCLMGRVQEHAMLHPEQTDCTWATRTDKSCSLPASQKKK